VPWSDPLLPTPSRREFLRTAGSGFGMLALAGLLQRQGLLAQEPGAAAARGLAGLPHHAAKATSVIWLFMYGGPSAMDTFDPKPALDKHHGQPCPEGIETFFKDGMGPLMKSPYSFKQYGESGAWVSECYPALAKCVDDIAWVRSMRSRSNNHAPALLEMNSGLVRVGFPSCGSWLNYGLGSENENLPGYVVMYDPRGGPIAGPQNWSAGFLPSEHQGVPFRAQGQPILDLARPEDVDAMHQRRQLDLLSEWNRRHASARPGVRELDARIRSFELAARMQLAAPEAIDVGNESEETKRLYGLDRDVSRWYGTQCLIARRLVERGVRFIQLYSGGGHQQDSWDAHFGLKENQDLHCPETDVPIAGLLTDLKRRGLLDSTLVVWGGEFGRMPMSQGANGGRDHNPEGYLCWLAGGGVQGGASIGATDEIGLRATEDPCDVHDLHATILHQMGINHERLTYFHNGRDFRLTDVAGRVLTMVLA
jgi:hypothetical protein